MSLAGVNYDSYDIQEDGTFKVTGRWEKLIWCYRHIHSLVKNNRINNEHYYYLLPHADYIRTNTGLLDTNDKVHSFLHTQIWKSFKVLFKIKE
jgi:hypothetical protein